ncbi:peptidase inhibitor family I36 protein [Streptomyces sp. NPDC001817]|uniref:peptidase inhibitor family I36 protein n=1 Tax=Streptomyces sp. NPDC001817 TaxID=3154398 RepID=UPI00331A4EDE
MKRARTLVAVAVAASAVTMMVVSPARAQVEPVLRLGPGDACPSNYVCFFERANFAEGGYAVAAGYSINDFQAIYFNDEMSSWVNNTNLYYCWYQHPNYVGIAYVMRPNSFVREEPESRDHTAASAAPCY